VPIFRLQRLLVVKILFLPQKFLKLVLSPNLHFDRKFSDKKKIFNTFFTVQNLRGHLCMTVHFWSISRATSGIFCLYSVVISLFVTDAERI